MWLQVHTVAPCDSFMILFFRFSSLSLSLTIKHFRNEIIYCTRMTYCLSSLFIIIKTFTSNCFVKAHKIPLSIHIYANRLMEVCTTFVKTGERFFILCWWWYICILLMFLFSVFEFKVSCSTLYDCTSFNEDWLFLFYIFNIFMYLFQLFNIAENISLKKEIVFMVRRP